jgi:hypothetical protein
VGFRYVLQGFTCGVWLQLRCGVLGFDKEEPTVWYGVSNVELQHIVALQCSISICHTIITVIT